MSRLLFQVECKNGLIFQPGFKIFNNLKELVFLHSINDLMLCYVMAWWMSLSANHNGTELWKTTVAFDWQNENHWVKPVHGIRSSWEQSFFKLVDCMFIDWWVSRDGIKTRDSPRHQRNNVIGGYWVVTGLERDSFCELLWLLV